MTTFNVRLLGPFAIRQNDQPLDVAGWRPQVARLFRILAASPDLRRSRDEIIDILWPDAMPEAGARNLGFALHMLRRSLDADPTPVLSERGWVVLNPQYAWDIDLHQLESLARTGLMQNDGQSLEAAAGVHGGEPLPLDRYEDWAQPIRDRLQRVWRDVCLRVAQLRLDTRSFEEAAGWIERTLEADPLDEEAFRELLRILRTAGRRADALRRSIQFEGLLRNELDVEPSPETMALVEELRAEAPARVVEQPRTNLPEATSRLIGRAREITAIAALLRRKDVRMVTLIGAGGAGKTRLALEVARGLTEEFPDGVFLVTLAPLADPALVSPAIGRTLGIGDSGEESLIASLVAAIGKLRMLLVLDNFEHLIAAADVVSELLRACGGLTVLVTSRERLHLSGEHIFRVPPLEIPALRGAVDPHTIAAIGAVQFFVQRAQASDPDFALTAENASAVASICRRLDGLPLAIELAAARSALLPPPTLLTRLEDASGRTSLQLLARGPRDFPERHRELRDTIAWSYNLLPPDEQRLFRCLSVFAGGCTIDAVEMVYGDAREAPVWEGMESLIEKSLVLRASANEGPRYAMLETLRAFAAERLEGAPGADAVRRSHAEYYLGLAVKAEAESKGPRQAEWYAHVEQDHDNARAALRWSLDAGEVEMSLQLGGALWRFWWTHSHLTEGRRWLGEILERSEGAPLSTRYEVLNGAGVLASTQCDYEQATAHFEEILRLYHEMETRPDRGGMSERAILRGTASTLNHLGIVAQEQGNHVRARALYEEALPLFQEWGDPYFQATILNNLGVVAGAQHELEAAERYYEESLALRKQIGDKAGIGMSLTNIGEIVEERGDHARAASLQVKGLLIGQELANVRLITACLEGIAVAILGMGNAQGAAVLFGAADALREATGNPVPPTERHRYDGWIEQCRAALGESLDDVWRRGKDMDLEDTIGHALWLVGASSSVTARSQ